MNSALAAFVEGKSKSGDWWHRDTRDAAAKQVAAMPLREPRAQEVNERLPSLSHAKAKGENSNQSGHLNASLQPAIVDENGEPSAQQPPNRPMATGDDSPSELEGGLRPKPQSREALAGSTNTISPVPRQTKDDHHGNDLANMIRATATRAAGLVRERRTRPNLTVWVQTPY